MAAFRYVVHGRVQGVGFRYFVRQEAERLGVTGFVRNLSDGRVEVVAEGSDDALVTLQASLERGPSFSRVEGVDRAPHSPRGDLSFHIR